VGRNTGKLSGRDKYIKVCAAIKETIYLYIAKKKLILKTMFVTLLRDMSDEISRVFRDYIMHFL
jgi:hypothetical protein